MKLRSFLTILYKHSLDSCGLDEPRQWQGFTPLKFGMSLLSARYKRIASGKYTLDADSVFVIKIRRKKSISMDFLTKKAVAYDVSD